MNAPQIVKYTYVRPMSTTVKVILLAEYMPSVLVTRFARFRCAHEMLHSLSHCMHVAMQEWNQIIQNTMRSADFNAKFHVVSLLLIKTQFMTATRWASVHYAPCFLLSPKTICTFLTNSLQQQAQPKSTRQLLIKSRLIHIGHCAKLSQPFDEARQKLHKATISKLPERLDIWDLVIVSWKIPIIFVTFECFITLLFFTNNLGMSKCTVGES